MVVVACLAHDRLANWDSWKCSHNSRTQSRSLTASYTLLYYACRESTFSKPAATFGHGAWPTEQCTHEKSTQLWSRNSASLSEQSPSSKPFPHPNHADVFPAFALLIPNSDMASSWGRTVEREREREFGEGPGDPGDLPGSGNPVNKPDPQTVSHL